MSVVVTLDIFSGRENPAWELTEDQIENFKRILFSAERQTNIKPAAFGQLGYRGFLVESFGEDGLDEYIYVAGGIADVSRFSPSIDLGNEELESFLLSTGSKYIEEEVAAAAESGFSQVIEIIKSQRTLLAIPPYNPGKWNNNATVRRNNNCYNYANDKITNTFAQPGRGSGQIYSFIDCGNVGAASNRDNQVSISNPNITPSQGHIIALVVGVGWDYHWYRRDSNNLWSHKPGQTAAKNVDNSGRLIDNPETCDRGDYTSFCGYYHCIPANTRIR